MPTYRAVLVGINYFGSSCELSGCINDVHNIGKLIQEKIGFLPEEITTLTDDQPKTSALYPSRANIIAAFTKAASEITQTGDVLFVHYSGHGTYMRQSYAKRQAGDEDDGRDECICPADYNEAGLIIDDDLRKMLIDSLPEGATFRAIFDNCYSGTVLDTRYVYRPATIKARNDNLYKTKNNNIPASKADAKYISGARDDQTAADTFADGSACGALTNGIIRSITKHGLNENCGTFLNYLHQYMIKNRYSQRPMLGSGLKEDITKTTFFFQLKR